VKVKSCSAKETVKTEPKRLSFEEIKKEEGIYHPHEAGGGIRVIVLAADDGEETAVLFYSSYGNCLQAAEHKYWKGSEFIKCEDEEVCFEIRKKRA